MRVVLARSARPDRKPWPPTDLETRLFTAKVVIAKRRRLLQTQRKDTPHCLPEAFVTGVMPANAAIASGQPNASRASPHSARIWAALIVPARDPIPG